LLHTATGALTGGLAGAAGAATASLTMRAMAEQIDKMDLPDGLKQGLAQIAAGAMGAAVGGNAGLAAAVNVEANNRQLHPREISWLGKNKEDAAQLLSEKLGRPVSQEEALRYLTMAGEGNVDEAYQRANGNNLGAQTSEERYAYNLAKQYIAANANGGFIDDSGQSQQLFVAKGNDFYNANIYSEYKNDQAYRDFYWNTMGDNLKPDNPTAAELALYQEREIIRLTNAAKDALSGAIPGIMAGAAGTIVKNSGQSKNTANSNKIDQAASSTGTESVKGADSAATAGGAADMTTAAQLRTQLSLHQAGVLDSNGQLTAQAIKSSDAIPLADGVIKNPSVVSELTSDGSKIADWGKYTTQSVTMPNGQSMQVHYYMNSVTGKVDYVTSDFKVKGVVKP